ncbi:TetR family transcriptional regulator [Dactylosporangium sp. NPDC006015]|uniref:TetR/AcrR family transcriptional regulator n=1 Tax=Dactylosporangium sp. NPDC006015 TaxID=3154576 RepID=UPI0033A9B330
MLPVTYRETNRARLRETLVTAARDLTIGSGWEGVRMADVAVAAGVSRQTVYNEFGDKAGLAEALAAREIGLFVGDVRAVLLRHGADVRAAGHAAIRHTLVEADANPLIKAILTGADGLLPYLTTRLDLLLSAATAVVVEWAGTHLPGHDPKVVAAAAESIVRLVVSHIVQPSQPPEQAAEELTDVLVRLLVP